MRGGQQSATKLWLDQLVIGEEGELSVTTTRGKELGILSNIFVDDNVTMSAEMQNWACVWDHDDIAKHHKAPKQIWQMPKDWQVKLQTKPIDQIGAGPFDDLRRPCWS